MPKVSPSWTTIGTPSSVRVRDLHLIEQTLQRLKPPAWPEEWLGAVDKPLAAKRSRVVRRELRRLPRTARQHQRRAPGTAVENAARGGNQHRPGRRQQYRQSPLRPDSLQWDLAELARLDVQLHPAPTEPLDLSQLSVAKGLAYVTAFVGNRAYREAAVTPAERADMDGFGLPIGVQELRAYKARPLAGLAGNAAIPAQRFWCRAFINCCHPRTNAPPPFFTRARSSTTRSIWAIAPKPLAMALCSTRVLPAITTAGTSSAAGKRGNGVIGRLLQPGRALGVAGVFESAGRPSGGATAMKRLWIRLGAFLRQDSALFAGPGVTRLGIGHGMVRLAAPWTGIYARADPRRRSRNDSGHHPDGGAYRRPAPGKHPLPARCPRQGPRLF